jgi:hypothetical protein
MMTRRSLILSPTLVLLAGTRTVHAAQAPRRPPEAGAAFPAQAPEVVREAVVAAHGNVERLKALVGRQQTLAKATYDWGFGDWESALGGASHVGQREIAEYLIANGAQPTIFSAAMLGQLEVVKAFVAASPGIHLVRGPHSIPLLRHAMAGGPAARTVVEYLTTLEDADAKAPRPPLSAAEIERLTGAYDVEGSGEPVVIGWSNSQLTFALAGRSRGLRHRGSFEFSPAGSDNVRVVFTDAASAVTLTVRDPDVVLTARKAL